MHKMLYIPQQFGSGAQERLTTHTGAIAAPYLNKRQDSSAINSKALHPLVTVSRYAEVAALFAGSNFAAWLADWLAYCRSRRRHRRHHNVE